MQVVGLGSQARYQKIHVHLKSPIGVSKFTVLGPTQALDIILESGVSKFSFVAEAESEDAASRNVSVLLKPCESPKPLSVHLAKRGAGVRLDLKYVTSGVALFEAQRFDAALAYYQVAYSEPHRKTTIDEYEAILRYNYARALHQTCIELSYDTCSVAQERLVEIRDAFNKKPDERKVYEEYARISKDRVMGDLEILEKHAAINQYKKGVCAARVGQSEAAIAQLERVVKAQAANPKVFSAVGVTRKRLEEDLGSLGRRIRF